MTKFFGFLTLAAMAAAFAPQALKAEPVQCFRGNAIMNGTYVASGTGTVTGVGPAATLGIIVYNGDGTGTVIFSTLSLNGASSTSANVPVAFTVNTDCTGSKVIGSGPSATHMNFTITPDGKTITWIITDTGRTISGTGVRMTQ